MKKKKNILFAVGCVALALMLTFSTYISLVVFGVITEENVKGSQDKSGTSYVDGNSSTPQENNNSENSTQSNEVSNNIGGNNASVTPNQQGNADVNANSGEESPNVQENSPVSNTSSKSNYYLDTKKTAKEVIDIYAEIMNDTKASKPGFTKIEYQDLPGDAQNRVVSEGADSIETVFGFIETLGLIVDEKTAYEEPFIHEKGEEMSKFPVFEREKGSYLTDPKGVKSYTYEKLKNGNIKLTFTLVDENNPEPIGENSNTSPSYTGAVFSPMSKAKIDNTINHPIVAVFASNIKYNLKYHDCKVEMVFNPENSQIVSLNHYAYINLSGSGNVVGGRMALDKQELVTVVLIKDFKY